MDRSLRAAEVNNDHGDAGVAEAVGAVAPIVNLPMWLATHRSRRVRGFWNSTRTVTDFCVVVKTTIHANAPTHSYPGP